MPVEAADRGLASQTWHRNLCFTMRFSAAAAAATEATSAELIRIKDDRDLARAAVVAAVVLHYDGGSVSPATK